jgi:hypothetical protein
VGLVLDHRAASHDEGAVGLGADRLRGLLVHPDHLGGFEQ